MPRSNSGVLQIATRATEGEPTLIVDSPGQLVGYIHCRTCYRCVHVDPAMFPPAPIPESYRVRLRCSKCGGRGADGFRPGWAGASVALFMCMLVGNEQTCFQGSTQRSVVIR